MGDYLVFTLTAALGSMGEFAGHDRRGSLTWPGRSAILGLLGAAKGIRRGGDFAVLDSLGMAIAVFDSGKALRDYHTIQSVGVSTVRNPQSRPQAIKDAGNRANTTLTQRDYRMGSLYGVAVWNGDLLALQAALRQPEFTLYLGRKSCPLAAPVAARLVGAVDPVEALSQVEIPPWRCVNGMSRIIADDGSITAIHRESRNDVPLDRTLWHFGTRTVAIAETSITPQVAGRGAA
ncbi:MAG: type I-E CRISPR-associated protein Cas5/CasD [Rhodobacteraceae bacterium]|nr:type I-E CRISPR-associated protein Cas5/CasD [Paracoccaceae bacterium]